MNTKWLRQMALPFFAALFVICFTKDLVEQLLLWAIGVTVPLTLRLTETRRRTGEVFRAYRWAWRWYPWCMLMGAVSFLFPKGSVAGFLSLPWLCFTMLVALYGFARLTGRNRWALEEIAIDSGLLYLALGGGWLTASRFGVPVLHFSEEIIALTGIHFHYSAFVVPIFVGLLGRWVDWRSRFPRGYRLMAVGVITGPMIVAMGITFSTVLEFVAVVWFVLALLIYTVLVLPVAWKQEARWEIRTLFLLSSLTIWGTMALSVLYSLGRMIHVSFLTIDEMVLFHGVGNAFGFVTAGAWAWLNILPPARVSPYGIPHSRLTGRWRIGADMLTRSGWSDETRRVTGLVDDFSAFARPDFRPEAVHPAIRSFYEDTLAYRLEAEVEWQKGFRRFSFWYARLTKRIEQCNLPRHGEAVTEMKSQLVAVKESCDGRRGGRAWVRTHADTGQAVFVAAYATHTFAGETYMNIGLPCPWGNLTGVLRMEHGDSPAGKGDGLVLTSLQGKESGDQGIYYYSRLGLFSLPLHERFHVWADEAGRLHAVHDMWIWKWKFLHIRYRLSRMEEAEISLAE
ncbi:YndJ family protein [Laceyella putida]|uniref:YndJ family protein n=1 Tax=Laceyella putida TaxID=110101 RepID=A0ABW2RJI4_9BACL